MESTSVTSIRNGCSSSHMTLCWSAQITRRSSGCLATLQPTFKHFQSSEDQSNPVKELLWNCSTRRGLTPKPTSLHVIVLPGLPRNSQSTFYSPTIDQLEVQTQQLVLYSGGYTQHAPDYWSHKSFIDVADLNGHKCGCCYSSCFT